MRRLVLAGIMLLAIMLGICAMMPDNNDMPNILTENIPLAIACGVIVGLIGLYFVVNRKT